MKLRIVMIDLKSLGRNYNLYSYNEKHQYWTPIHTIHKNAHEKELTKKEVEEQFYWEVKCAMENIEVLYNDEL